METKEEIVIAVYTISGLLGTVLGVIFSAYFAFLKQNLFFLALAFFITFLGISSFLIIEKRIGSEKFFRNEAK